MLTFIHRSLRACGTSGAICSSAVLSSYSQMITTYRGNESIDDNQAKFMQVA